MLPVVHDCSASEGHYHAARYRRGPPAVGVLACHRQPICRSCARTQGVRTIDAIFARAPFLSAVLIGALMLSSCVIHLAAGQPTSA